MVSLSRKNTHFAFRKLELDLAIRNLLIRVGSCNLLIVGVSFRNLQIVKEIMLYKNQVALTRATR